MDLSEEIQFFKDFKKQLPFDTQHVVDKCVMQIRGKHFEEGLLHSSKVEEFCKRVWKHKHQCIASTSIQEWFALNLLSKHVKNAPRSALINTLMKDGILSSPLTISQKKYSWGYFTCNIDSYGECRNIPQMLYAMRQLYSLFDHVFDSSFASDMRHVLMQQSIPGVEDVGVGTKVKQIYKQSSLCTKDHHKDFASKYHISTPHHSLYKLSCEPAVDEPHTYYFELSIPITFYYNTLTLGRVALCKQIRVIRIGVRFPQNPYFANNTKSIIQVHIRHQNINIHCYNLFAMGMDINDPIAGVILVFAYVEERGAYVALCELMDMLALKPIVNKRLVMIKNKMRISEEPQNRRVMQLTISSILASMYTYNVHFISPLSLEDIAN